MDSVRALQAEDEDTLNSSSEEICLETKIDIAKKDIQLMSEFGMSELLPEFVEELTAYQSRYVSLTGRPYQRPSRSRARAAAPGRNGVAFWKSVSSMVNAGDLASGDRTVLAELCSSKGWTDIVPAGLMMSYTYLYQCVRGIGSEDAPIIERDVLRTVGAVKVGAKVFQDTSELGKAGLARAMHRVLTAISVTDGMGYCQGMNYVVDFMLKVVSEDDAFCLFLYALRCQHLCTLYETKLPVLSDLMEIFELQLSFQRPVLAAALKDRGFMAPFYSIEWFTTLFTLSCPPALTLFIWDLFFFGFKDTLLRCALGLMIVLEEKLLLMDTESLLKDFRSVCMTVDPAAVILEIFKIHIVPMKYHNGGKGPPYLERVTLSAVRSGAGGPGAMRRNSKLLAVYDDGARGEKLLLRLRYKYLPEAQTAIQERDAIAEKWGQLNAIDPVDSLDERDEAGLALSTTEEVGENAENSSSDEAEVPTSSVESRDSETEPSVCESLDDNPSTVMQCELFAPMNRDEGGHDNVSSGIPSPEPAVFVGREGEDNTPPARPVNCVLESARKRKSFAELSNEHLSDSKVYAKIADLRDTITRCNRLAHWLDLNKMWFECLLLLRSDLQRYNIADHLLRFSISCGGHIRVIGFFLAIAGADPNAQDRWLCTPLHIAAKYNRPDAARLLLLCGADKTIQGALLWSARSPLNSSMSSVPIIGLTAEQLVVSQTTTSSSSYSSQSVPNPAVLNILKGRVCSLCNNIIAQGLHSVPAINKGCSGPVCVCDITLCQRCTQQGSHWCVRVAFLERRTLAAGLHEHQMIPPPPSEALVGNCPPVVIAEAIEDSLPAQILQASRSTSAPGRDTRHQQIIAPVEPVGAAHDTLHSMAERRSSISEASTDSGFLDGQEPDAELESKATKISNGVNDKAATVGRTHGKILSRFRSFSFSTELNYRRGHRDERSVAISQTVNGQRMKNEADRVERLPKPISSGEHRNILPVDCKINTVTNEQRPKRRSFKSLFSRRKNSINESMNRNQDDSKNSSDVSSSWLRKVGLRRSISNNKTPGHVQESSDVPAYWVGYRGLEEWPLQSWQLYLLPLVIGADPFTTRGSDITVKDESQPSVLGQRNKLAPLEYFSGDPELLCFRNDISCFYQLMSRDSRISVIHIDMEGSAHNGRRSRSLDDREVSTEKSNPAATWDPQRNRSRTVEKTVLSTDTVGSQKKKFPLEDETSLGDVKLPARSGDTNERRLRLQRNELGRFFLSGRWTVSDGDPLWAPDDSAWHCSTCFVVFTMFQRKHHCRRCGGLFCNEHAPLVDILPHCTPDYLIPHLKRQVYVEALDVKPVRLCAPCRYEMKHAPELQEEIRTCQKKYSLSFWQTMTVMNRPLNAVIHRHADHSDSMENSSNDIKGVTFAKFPIAGHWTDSMTGLLWGQRSGNDKSAS